MSRLPALALCVAAALPGCVEPAADPSATRAVLAGLVASCAATSGQVQVRRAGETAWGAVAVGSVFRAGDSVRAAAQSTARLEFLAGGHLLLEPGAVLTLAAGGRLSLEEGQATGALPAATGLALKGREGAELKLEGSGPVAFRISKGAHGPQLAVTEGKATLVTAAKRVEITEGEVAPLAAAPVVREQVPFPTSLAPGVDARFVCRPDQPISLAWQAAPGAAGYLVQVSRDLSFQQLYDVQDVKGSYGALRGATPGLYVWRVASKDAEGAAGEFGFARRIFCEATPPRELLLAPAADAQLTLPGAELTVAFSWQSAGAVGYRLAVAKSQDLLDAPVAHLATHEQRVEVALAEGRYYWGVYTDEELPRPLFLAPRLLVLHRADKVKLKTPKTFSDWGATK